MYFEVENKVLKLGQLGFCAARIKKTPDCSGVFTVGYGKGSCLKPWSLRH